MSKQMLQALKDKHKLSQATYELLVRQVDIAKKTLLQYEVKSQAYVYVPKQELLNAYLFMLLYNSKKINLVKKKKTTYNTVQKSLRDEFESNYSSQHPEQINVAQLGQLFNSKPAIQQKLSQQLSKIINNPEFIYSFTESGHYDKQLRISSFQKDKLQLFSSIKNKEFLFKEDKKNDVVIFRSKINEKITIVLGLFNNIEDKASKIKKSKNKLENGSEIIQDQVMRPSSQVNELEEQGSTEVQKRIEKQQKWTFVILMIIFLTVIYEVKHPTDPFYLDYLKLLFQQ